MNSRRTFVFLLLGSLLTAQCMRSRDVAGTETTDEFVLAGRVLDSAGNPAPGAVVTLLDVDYNPLGSADTAARRSIATDPRGAYRFTSVYSGIYNILAADQTKEKVGIVQQVTVGEITSEATDSIIAAPCTIAKGGTVAVTLSSLGTLETGSVFYIPGTDIFTLIDDSTKQHGTINLLNVPAGTYTELRYYEDENAVRSLNDSILVSPSAVAQVIVAPGWSYSKEIVLNTAPGGADVAGTVTDFPVLIRLTPSNFAFSQAQNDGEDIRFVKASGSPLPYEIERWDAVHGHAEIWVKLDTVYGNDSIQSIAMLWGNPGVTDASNGAAVFDTARGFQGVWHLAQDGGATAFDATGNHFDGTPNGMTVFSAVPGMIGGAQEFDGSASYIEMSGTAAGKLNFPENGYYTLSGWAYTDTLDTTYQAIASKGDMQYNLELFREDTGSVWEFAEYHDQIGWHITTSSPAREKVWVYVTGIRAGDLQYLYVNGACVDSISAVVSATYRRYTEFDFVIGRVRRQDVPEYHSFFNGKIDEVRVEDAVRSAEWIQLCYMNQKEDDALVSLR